MELEQKHRLTGKREVPLKCASAQLHFRRRKAQKQVSEPQDIRVRVSAEEWETFRRCRFVQRTFHPYPCLVIEPLNDEGGSLWKPYRGEPFDPAVYELIEGGWDHEHCDVCYAHIVDGNEYWANDGPEHVDLCIVCYPLVQDEMHAAPGTSLGASDE